MGWTSPVVLTGLIGGVALLVMFCFLGARAFASGGLIVSTAAFGGLLLIPANFSYPEFAASGMLARQARRLRRGGVYGPATAVLNPDS